MKQNKQELIEYDFSKGVRGKYAEAYHKSSNVVKIDTQLTKKFPNAVAVNKALREYAKLAKI